MHRFPHKANVVKVNSLTRALLVDDMPFLPMGFYLEWKRWQVGGENFTIAMFDEVANGFNTPLPYRSGTPQELVQYGYLEFMDNMQKMGMKVHFSKPEFPLIRMPGKWIINTLFLFVETCTGPAWRSLHLKRLASWKSM